MKTKEYVESLKICSQIYACDPCNLEAHQLILNGGGGEFIYGIYIYIIWNLYREFIYIIYIFIYMEFI